MLIRFMESFFDKIGEPQSPELQDQARRQKALSERDNNGSVALLGPYADKGEPAQTFQDFLGWLAKNHGADFSQQFLHMEQGFTAEREPPSFALAQRYVSAGDKMAALKVLDQVLIDSPKNRQALKLFIEVAEEIGWLRMIVRKLDDVKRFAALPASTETYRQKLDGALRAFERGAGIAPRETFNYSHAAIRAAVGAAHAAGQARRMLAEESGKMILMTGSLGPGGAEQQLVRSAIVLHREIEAAKLTNAADTDPLFKQPASVEVWAESLTRRANGDFFLHRLDAEGVPFRIVDRFTRRNVTAEERRSFQALAMLLPKGAFRNFHKLRQNFEAARPDIVMIWQDGMIFSSVLAALWAGVPRIVCAFRGMPPNLRRHRANREFEVLFRALLDCPNVRFVANSEVVGEHYAHWLKADPSRFLVLPNFLEGATQKSVGPAVSPAALDDAGPLSGFKEVVGGAFRFDVNKNPFVWVDVAKRVAAERISTGFVMIGDGPLFEAVKTYAEVEGMGDKIHFTGASQSVGDWLRRCDAFLHVSKTEGLPNVLLEAQAAGVPVVATDAGGTRETVADGRTAILVSLQQDNDGLTEDAAQGLLSLLSDHGRRARMGDAAKQFIAENFSRDQFVRRIGIILGDNEGALESVAVKPKIEFKPEGERLAPHYAAFASEDFGNSIQTFAFDSISSNKLKVGSTARKLTWNPIAPFVVWYALLKSYSGLRPFYREFILEKTREHLRR
ncbi:MAG: glycosyltransferase [Pseudomonadota bacterium]